MSIDHHKFLNIIQINFGQHKNNLAPDSALDMADESL